MVDTYILGKRQVMAVKLEDNETSLEQAMHLLGENFVGFVYKQDKPAYCAIKWSGSETPIYANIGDWIIKNDAGRFEICQNDIFMKEYESLFLIAKAKKTSSPKTTWWEKFFEKHKRSLLNCIMYLIILNY